MLLNRTSRNSRSRDKTDWELHRNDFLHWMLLRAFFYAIIRGLAQCAQPAHHQGTLNSFMACSQGPFLPEKAVGLTNWSGSDSSFLSCSAPSNDPGVGAHGGQCHSKRKSLWQQKTAATSREIYAACSLPKHMGEMAAFRSRGLTAELLHVCKTLRTHRKYISLAQAVTCNLFLLISEDKEPCQARETACHCLGSGGLWWGKNSRKNNSRQPPLKKQDHELQ